MSPHLPFQDSRYHICVLLPLTHLTVPMIDRGISYSENLHVITKSKSYSSATLNWEDNDSTSVPLCSPLQQEKQQCSLRLPSDILLNHLSAGIASQAFLREYFNFIYITYIKKN